MVEADLSLRDAATLLIRREIHGAPVVDAVGRCVGVLSVSDVARWVSGRSEARGALPRTCAFQEKCREPGGRETTLCCLAEGACPMQRLRELPNGKLALACVEPNAVPVDWQTVETDPHPGDTVRDYMTNAVLSVDPTTTVTELARLMLDHQIHRVVVLDAEQRPVGVVTVNDLLQVLAHPEIAALADCE
jgi:CBS domain-containing protein